MEESRAGARLDVPEQRWPDHVFATLDLLEQATLEDEFSPTLDDRRREPLRDQA